MSTRQDHEAYVAAVKDDPEVKRWNEIVDDIEKDLEEAERRLTAAVDAAVERIRGEQAAAMEVPC